ncbi:NAD-dependent epimerase dehydratase [Colletotrichum tofieldiae]|uniref:NAD-dependent epimerase dehydratase n=1 Tax=Colletotrichum tofieldiae TaxID=708197 RepID=A0A166LNG7_9PEZI|nr:NAD-dependent epimerase dehydratase [Colletotrichum tofieldiae]
MHVLILGATGRNGALVLAEALERGHTVTALVRDPSNTALTPHTNLTLARGNPLSLADVRAAMRTPRGGPDAVVVALNARHTPAALIHDSVRNALEAMRGASPRTRKLVVNSMQGAGASSASLIFPLRALFNHSNMKHTLDDHNAVDALVKGEEGKGVDWVLVRPPMLTEGEPLPVKVYGDDGSGARWMPKITRRSVAGFMVDAIEKDEWNRKAPVITN